MGFKLPMCDYSKMAIERMDTNPRHRPDNILMIDLNVT